jgi:hypothetical protein
MKQSDSPVKRKMQSLAKRIKAQEKIALQCWCAPKACHGDVIKGILEDMIVSDSSNLLK